MKSSVFLFTFMLFISGSAGVLSQTTQPAYFEQPGEVILPQRYNRSKEYPLFVVLPPTGAYASQVISMYGIDPQLQESFILLLPEGRSTRDEYLPDFMTFVGWYEERLLSDIASVLETYDVDEDRIYVGGYSLGGDLSWALSVRSPDLFAGAVIAGSRTSHPVEDDALRVMKERGFRAAFLIGNREDPLRYRGINVARQRLEEVGVAHMYEEYRGAHDMPPMPLIKEAVMYVTDEQELPTPGPELSVARRTNARPSNAPLFNHVSRDRFAVSAALPAAIGPGGLSVPDDTYVSLRVELPWERLYIRSTATYVTSMTTTGLRNRRLSQDVLGAWGDGRYFYGLGAGWDWLRGTSDETLYRTTDLLLMHGMRNPPFIPAGRDPQRVDSLMIMRYSIPPNIGVNPSREQLLNLRGEYLLRIADLFVFDLAGGTYTIQNADVNDLNDLADAVDHRWEWEAGVALRAPSPFLWRVGYRGTAERPIEEDSYSLRGTWTVSMAFSY